ncbi:MAG: zf-HC2 domain-containing protein [Acidobacteria bacterium]|nr:zf-HC2 domain-containing protein [Acidobacteriota bacterium]
MNCEKCHELLSDFLDGTMVNENRALLSRHLDECLSCACVREEISAIVSTAHESRDYYVAPPNEGALWLRIRNTIEAELDAQQRAAVRAAGESPRESFLSRWMNRRWALSLPQLAGTVAAIAVGTSLLTTYGVQQFWSANQLDAAAISRPNVPPGNTRRSLNPDQMLAIEYLKGRVEQRKARWNPQMRESFDRNLSVIDATVNEALTTLDQAPHDEISEETLNTALRDKLELLKEFSEL